MAKKGTGKGLGRENIKYVGIPTELWEELSVLAESLDRSLAWLTRQAIKEYLERNPPPRKDQAKPETPKAKGKKN